MRRAVIVEPESAGNIGFIARLADNFGIDQVYLVSPQCDIESDAAKSRAVHAQDTLRSMRIVDTLDTALDGLDSVIGTTGIEVRTENVHRHGIPSDRLRETVPDNADTAVVFGRESTGLTNAELDACDFVVHIPTNEAYPVMNLSHAAAIIFYELTRIDTDPDQRESITARQQRDALENLFKGVTESLGYDEDRAALVTRALKNVLGRAHATEAEYGLLLGMFRELSEARTPRQHT